MMFVLSACAKRKCAACYLLWKQIAHFLVAHTVQVNTYLFPGLYDKVFVSAKSINRACLCNTK